MLKHEASVHICNLRGIVAVENCLATHLLTTLTSQNAWLGQARRRIWFLLPLCCGGLHGVSLKTFYRRMQGEGPTILLLQERCELRIDMNLVADVNAMPVRVNC